VLSKVFKWKTHFKTCACLWAKQRYPIITSDDLR